MAQQTTPHEAQPSQNPLRAYFDANRGALLNKWLHYFDVYDRHFARYRGREIVMVEIGHSGADGQAWMAALRAAGLGAGAWSRTSIRLVTHRHIDDAAVEQAVGIVRAVAAKLTGKVLEKAG